MKIVFLICLMVLMAGCTSNRSPKINAATIPWNDRIGTYTLEQAQQDLGKPALISESDAGTSAEWILKRSAQMSLGLGVGSFGRHSGVGVGTGVPLPAHGEYLRLRFGTDGRLKEWAKTKY
jgi:hypothetical protein